MMTKDDLRRYAARLVELRDDALRDAARETSPDMRLAWRSRASAYALALHALYTYSGGQFGEYDTQPEASA